MAVKELKNGKKIEMEVFVAPGILCPQCKSDKNVVCSTRKGIKEIRRYRRCLDCGRNFMSIEIV